MGRKSMKKATETATDTSAATKAPEPTGDTVTVNKRALQDALQSLQTIADRKSAMPMLGRIAIRVMGLHALQLVATDLNLYLTVTLGHDDLLRVDASQALGITLDAKAALTLVKGLPDGVVSLSRSDVAWAKITSGRVAARLQSIPDREFPKIPNHASESLQWFTLDAGMLCDMIDRTAFSACPDETRFHLNGALVESDGTTLRMVTTDGHRLTKIERVIADVPVAKDVTLQAPDTAAWNKGFIVPRKGLTEIKRILDNGPCSVAFEAPYLHVKQGNAVLTVKIIDAQFPPYNQVIPTRNKHLVTCAKQPLIDALKRATMLTCETRGVSLDYANGELAIKSDNPDMGDMRETIDAEGLSPVCVGFNAKYLLDLLPRIDGERIVISLGAPLDPGLFRGIDDAAQRPVIKATYLGVVMPMRI